MRGDVLERRVFLPWVLAGSASGKLRAATAHLAGPAVRVKAWWLVGVSLLAVAAVNASLSPDHELTILYVLPLLIAARRLSLRAIVVATIAALLLLVATTAHSETPWPVTMMAAASLLAVSYLAVLLAVQRTRTAQRTRVAEAQVAVAVKRTRQAELLVELGELLRVCTTPAEVDAVIGRVMPRMFPDSDGALYHMSPSRDSLQRGGQWGARSTASREQFRPLECWALRRGRAHVVDGLGDGLPCAHVPPDMTYGYTCIPLMAQTEALGLLHVRMQPEGVAAPSVLPDQQRLAAVVAEQLALTLANLRLQARLRDEALHDSLTGLLNRRFLDEHLHRAVQQALRSRQPLSVVMLDIDLFKRFNDTFGHEAGDTLLRALGRLLQALFRGGDLACRYGGEEFLLVLPGASLADAEQRAEQLRQTVRQLLRPPAEGNGAPVTVSLGVAAAPEHGTSPESLVAAADAALYRAKAAGRDRVVLAGGGEHKPGSGGTAAA